MKPQVLSPHPLHLAGDDGRTAVRAYRFIVDRFLLLPLGALVALLWANTAADSYFRVAHSLQFVVNQVGMALFLALIAQDVLEAIMPQGSLHTWRRWSVPLVAAIGGVAGSVGVFLLYVGLAHEAVLTAAWPVACAIDIAAGYYVIKMIAPRSSMIAFLVLLAAATDLFALFATAAWQPFRQVQVGGLALLAAAIALAALLHRRQHREIWTYALVAGPLAWAGLYLAGIHPALALLPIVPFLPREPRREIFAEPAASDDVHRSEHAWHDIVQIVLFF
ncbi:MAG: Na+/H+ antiporter NhaA, partial [Vicinamibacterales bacterium]